MMKARRFIAPKEMTVMEKTRQELETGIFKHTQIILNMKHKLNQLVTIARLPPELLTEVFLHFVDAESRQNERSGRPYTWLRITHICHYWREVALSSPRLWSTIFVTQTSCVKEMLARSKKVPLEILAGDPAWQSSRDAARLAIQQLGRIHRLELRSASLIAHEDIPESAPLLKTLILKGMDEMAMMAMFSPQTTVLFDSCDMPILEHLEVTDYNLRWASPIFRPTLTRLVFGTAVIASHTPALIDILNALAAMPLLQYLELRNVLPRVNNPDAIRETASVVTLDRLSALCITDSGLSCAQLLEHLSFPTSTTISLDCRLSLAEVHSVCPSLASKLSGVSTLGQIQPLVSLSLQSDIYRTTRLKGWSTLHPVSDFVPSKSILPPPHVEVAFHLPTDPSVFRALFDSLPLSGVQSLYLAPAIGYTHLPKDIWVKCCADMTELRQLCVGRWGEGSLPEVLSARIPLSAEPVRKGGRRRLQPFFPKLELLRFEGTRLRPPYFEDDKLLTRYRKALEKRKKSRVQLEQLVIQRCFNISKADVESLKGLAKEVKWDGIEVHEDPDTDSDMYDDPDLMEWDETEDEDLDFMPFGFHAGPFWF